MKFYCIIKVIDHEKEIYEYCGSPCIGYEEAMDLACNRLSAELFGNEIHSSFLGNDTSMLWGDNGEEILCYYIVGGER